MSHSTQYRSFRRRWPRAVMYTSHSVMEGQRGICMTQLRLSVVNLSFFLQESPALCVSPSDGWWGGLVNDDVIPSSSSSAETLHSTVSVPGVLPLPAASSWLWHSPNSVSSELICSSLFSRARVSCWTSLSRASSLLSSVTTVSRPNLQTITSPAVTSWELQ